MSSLPSLLVHNARITADPDDVGTEHTWLLARGGVVERLGGSDDALPDEPGLRVVDAGGRRVVPGLHDAHIHVLYTGQSLVAFCDLAGCASVDEFTRRLRERAAREPEGGWVFGRGWEQDVLGRYPTRSDIDEAVGGRPALVWRACLHVCVVNSAAQRALGLPEGGDGLLKETEAHDAAKRASEGVTPDTVREWLAAGARECVRRGLTAVQTNDRDAWPGYARLADDGELPLRVFLTVNFDEVSPRPRNGVPAPGAAHPSGLLSCDRLKLFADGSLGADTAALSCKHKHGPAHHGILIVPPEEMAGRVAEAGRLGYRVEMHAIGDAAADVALDAFERASSRRPLLTHCQVMRGPQLDRMVRLGVIANVQPQFVVTDSRWADAKLGPLGLLEYSYAWRTMLDRGVAVAGGSDSPIEFPDPFDGMRAAVFRDWRAHEALTVQQALRLYTRGAAFAACREADMGALLPGFVADFVVLTHDFVADREALREAGPAEVWVAGERRF